MPFIEAFRQFQFRAGKDNFCCLLVSLVPQPGPNGVHKTKPIQHSVRELRGQGLSPDLVSYSIFGNVGCAEIIILVIYA